MKTVFYNLVFIVLVFFGGSMHQIHALTGKGALPTRAGVFSSSCSTDDSHNSSFSISYPSAGQFIVEDTEEEEQEEEVIEETHQKKTGNYFTVVYGVSKIHYDHITQPATPLVWLEPHARFGEKRYLYLEVFRL